MNPLFAYHLSIATLLRRISLSEKGLHNFAIASLTGLVLSLHEYLLWLFIGALVGVILNILLWMILVMIIQLIRGLDDPLGFKISTGDWAEEITLTDFISGKPLKYEPSL